MPERTGDRDSEPVLLRTAIARYPHTAALRDGEIPSTLLRFDFADMPTINRAFAPMVRERRFDVSEMAIATFLQAKAYGKSLVLLPVVLSARFQEPALLCRSDSDVGGPHDLAGRRVGVRAYSQTTGVWLRGILADAHGVRPRDIHWITFEDAHVAEYRDPTWVERAPAGRNLMGMLRQGELDAVIVGNELPNDASLRTVFPDPEAAAAAFWHRHRFVPINHLLTVPGELAHRRPDVIAELVRLFRKAKAMAPSPAHGHDAYPSGRAALAPAISLALRYALEQGLLPRHLDLADVWQGLSAEEGTAA
jgi:4,5-dihydroxyphthalate decarboxylase